MACGTNSGSFQSLIECPVCYEVMHEPKQLQCGHTLCKDCLRHLIGYIECPVCRELSYMPSKGFPTNYTVVSLVSQLKEQKEPYNCMACDKGNPQESMIICYSCGDMSLCLGCFFTSHKEHDTEQLQDYIGAKSRHLEKWKKEKLNLLNSFSMIPANDLISESYKLKQTVDRNLCSEEVLYAKRKEFEEKLGKLIVKETDADGFSFDLVPLEKEFETLCELQDEVTVDRQQLIDKLKMLDLHSDDSFVSDTAHSHTTMSDNEMPANEAPQQQFHGLYRHSLPVWLWAFLWIALAIVIILMAAGTNSWNLWKYPCAYSTSEFCRDYAQ